jgi:hypothetical protein
VRIPAGWRPLAIGALLLAVALSIVVGYRARTADREQATLDFRDFWLTAERLRTTGQVVTDEGVHNYLPFFSIFMLPWSYIPLQPAAVVFTLGSLLLGVAALLMMEILLDERLPPRPRPAFLIALGLMLAYIWSCGVLGQMGLLLLFLVVATWFLAARGAEWEAGFALGLAAAIKLLPAVLILFFLLKRRWRIFGAATGAFVILAFGLPLAGFGWKEFVVQHERFVNEAVVGHSARSTIYADKPQKAKYNNNALPIVLRRLLTPTDYLAREGGPQRFVNFADLPRPIVFGVYAVILGAIVTCSLAGAVRGGPRWPPGDLDSARALQAQFGAWCALSLLAAPLLWTHYLVLAYPALAIVCDRLERAVRARRSPDAIALTAILLWTGGLVSLAFPAARGAGAQYLSVLALWAACIYWALTALPPGPPPTKQRPRRLELRRADEESEGVAAAGPV